MRTFNLAERTKASFRLQQNNCVTVTESEQVAAAFQIQHNKSLKYENNFHDPAGATAECSWAQNNYGSERIKQTIKKWNKNRWELHAE